MKQTDTTEKGLETHIAQYLVNKNGFVLRENTAYDNVVCLDSDLWNVSNNRSQS